MTRLEELSPRLRAIAERVPPGRPLADLCCDHAQLAAALVVEGRVPWAIAADLNPGPLRAATALVAALGIGDRVTLRQGDGASVLAAGEVATVVIAGVGAPLAETILAEGQASLAGVSRLIVQVNHGFPKLGRLRARLGELGWALVDEAIAEDQGRLYPILVAEPGAPGLLDETDRELGPILRRSADPLTRAWFERERSRVERALAGMQRGSADAEALAQYRRYLELLG
ncbi:MAG: class I SAM-dependent methyltransferase [Enhygromyxa sp.]